MIMVIMMQEFIERRLYKRYVTVISVNRKDGSLVPIYIIWEDGTRYKIDQIIKIINAKASEVGGVGKMYQVRIGRHIRNLFYEKNRWFVESHKP
ncbi:hypothetical protein [Intestinibaculum porci]|jgi:hypothetical protein|nr:hypothetical protein [Intestinibaculum porci]